MFPYCEPFDFLKNVERRSALSKSEQSNQINLFKFATPLIHLFFSANREPASLVMRKEFFEDIAVNLRSIDDTLTAAVVEKQWKNLKVKLAVTFFWVPLPFNVTPPK